MKRSLYLLVAVSAFAASHYVAAQATGAPPGPLVLHPAAEPRPFLKYELLPSIIERRPGNAAVLYNRMTAERITFFGDRELWENIRQWSEAPLAELRTDEVRQTFDLPDVFHDLDRAARCESCDWQVPIGEEDSLGLLPSEFQQARYYAQLLAVRARIQIAEGRFDEAVRTLQTGYALARHVGQGPDLIHGLIGVRYALMMSEQVQAFIQQPGAPNLYWALTQLPRPLIDIRRAVEAEKHAVYLSFPEVRDLEDPVPALPYWRQSLERLWQRLIQHGNLNEGTQRPEVLTALCVRGYPMAKRALIQRGFSAEEVRGMPVPQVILLYTMQTYEELRDDVFRWVYVPYLDSVEGIQQAEKRVTQRQREGREILPLAGVLLPNVGSVRNSIVRTDREIAALRTIEALRIYAAGHKGRLPRELAEVTEVPIPVDPGTGRPFGYRLAGDTAVLEGPGWPPTRLGSLRFEIKMAP